VTGRNTPKRDYLTFLDKKRSVNYMGGFRPTYIPEFLFDFQKALLEWSVQMGRCAIFADCGLGKTVVQLAWAENVVRHTAKPVLILTPLAVSYQTVAEGEKFGIGCTRATGGAIRKSWPKIVITNYERLERFDYRDFSGVVCDESSILKNFNGARRSAITQFMKQVQYRLLCTATAAPNDYTELGTSSEALGFLGHMDMLARFFKNDQASLNPVRVWKGAEKWRLKSHAETAFWEWVCSWARACRYPSDLGFDDGLFILPPLYQTEYFIRSTVPRDGCLFDLPAVGLKEQREERHRTITERCEKVADLVNGRQGQSLVWCHLNKEGDALSQMIPDAKQVSGSDSDDYKEETLTAFAQGELNVLVTKPRIGAWGLNLQRCSHVTFFPSHSYEQFYQGVRRCWRFGQQNPVSVDIVATEGDQQVIANLKRKSEAADRMFTELVKHMNTGQVVTLDRNHKKKVRFPQWVQSSSK